MRGSKGPLGLTVCILVAAAWISSPAQAAISSAAAAAGGAAEPLASHLPQNFDLQVELQGLYDEISEAEVPYVDELDIDLLHSVLYTPDWVFVDAAGHRRTWQELRDHAAQTAPAAAPESAIQRIQTVSLGPDGATALVNSTTERTIVDKAGRYGRAGATHTLSETTRFRDKWVRDSDEWKLKSREQIGRPTVAVDALYRVD